MAELKKVRKGDRFGYVNTEGKLIFDYIFENGVDTFVKKKNYICYSVLFLGHACLYAHPVRPGLKRLCGSGLFHRLNLALPLITCGKRI